MYNHQKTPEHILYVVTLTLLLTTLAGCQTLIRAEGVMDNIRPLLTRHDAYARALLTGAARRQALTQSAVVRVNFNVNRGGSLPTTLATHILPVLNRHDNWVRNDIHLHPTASAVYLASSVYVRLKLGSVFLQPMN